MRLLWARAGVPHCPNDGTPVTARAPSQIAGRVLGWPEGTRIEMLGADGPRTQGRVQGALRGLPQAGLRPGPGRRRDLRPRRRARRSIAARTTISPWWSIAWWCATATRPRLNDSIETALKVGRRRGGGAKPATDAAGRPTDRRSSASVSRAPSCGLSLRRARAAAVLVQLAVRRLSGLPRPRDTPRSECRTRARRSAHLDSRRRRPALGRADRVPPESRAADAGADVQVRPRRAVADTARGGAAALLHGPRARNSSSRRGRRAGGEYESEWEGSSRTSNAAIARRRATRCAGLEEFMVEQPCAGLRRAAAQAGEPRRCWWRAEHR